MANPEVTLKVEGLRAKQERVITVSAVSDRERVLQKLRALLETNDGGAHVTAQLKAAQLLGQTIGLYKDVQVTDDQTRSPEDIEAEIRQRLALMDEEDDRSDALH